MRIDSDQDRTRNLVGDMRDSGTRLEDNTREDRQKAARAVSRAAKSPGDLWELLEMLAIKPEWL